MRRSQASLYRSSHGIDDEDMHRGKVGDVTGHDAQSVLHRGGCDESVGNTDSAPRPACRCVEIAPQPRRLGIYGENALGKTAFQPIEPGCELAARTAFLEPGHAGSYLTERNDAQEGIVFGKCPHRRFDLGSAFGPADLRDNAGIEEGSQSSTSRIGVLSRSNSTPSSDGPLIR